MLKIRAFKQQKARKDTNFFVPFRAFRCKKGRLFNQSQNKGVAIDFAFGGGHGAQNGKDNGGNGNSKEQWDSDQNDHQDATGNRGNQQRDLEIQHFFAGCIEKLRGFAFHQPDDQRNDKGGKGDNKTCKQRQMANQTKRALIRIRRGDFLDNLRFDWSIVFCGIF